MFLTASCYMHLPAAIITVQGQHVPYCQLLYALACCYYHCLGPACSLLPVVIGTCLLLLLLSLSRTSMFLTASCYMHLPAAIITVQGQHVPYCQLLYALACCYYHCPGPACSLLPVVIGTCLLLLLLSLFRASMFLTASCYMHLPAAIITVQLLSLSRTSMFLTASCYRHLPAAAAIIVVQDQHVPYCQLLYALACCYYHCSGPACSLLPVVICTCLLLLSLSRTSMFLTASCYMHLPAAAIIIVQGQHVPYCQLLYVLACCYYHCPGPACSLLPVVIGTCLLLLSLSRASMFLTASCYRHLPAAIITVQGQHVPYCQLLYALACCYYHCPGPACSLLPVVICTCLLLLSLSRASMFLTASCYMHLPAAIIVVQGQHVPYCQLLYALACCYYRCPGPACSLLPVVICTCLLLLSLSRASMFLTASCYMHLPAAIITVQGQHVPYCQLLYALACCYYRCPGPACSLLPVVICTCLLLLSLSRASMFLTASCYMHLPAAIITVQGQHVPYCQLLYTLACCYYHCPGPACSLLPVVIATCL